MTQCRECAALHAEGKTCREDFHALLGWETEYPGYGVVHHLTVLCYHLQHPSLYSPEGLAHAKGLLVDFLEWGKSTEQIRRQNRNAVSSSKRTWKVTARPGAQGTYEYPVRWTMTVADVAADDNSRYIENAKIWADPVLEALRASGKI